MVEFITAIQPFFFLKQKKEKKSFLLGSKRKGKRGEIDSFSSQRHFASRKVELKMWAGLRFQCLRAYPRDTNVFTEQLIKQRLQSYNML